MFGPIQRTVNHKHDRCTIESQGGLHSETPGLWKAIWGAQVIWVKANLIRRGMNVPLECVICGEEETREHMLMGCGWTEPIWATMWGPSRAEAFGQNTIRWLDHCRTATNQTGTNQGRKWEACMITTWHIWKTRCKAEFEGARPNLTRVIDDITVTYRK